MAFAQQFCNHFFGTGVQSGQKSLGLIGADRS